MGGDSIAEVRNALQLCLRSLRAGCRFNIVSFGTSYAALFPESRTYDEASLQEAAAFVTAVDANMGGTEILPALEYAVHERQIVAAAERRRGGWIACHLGSGKNRYDNMSTRARSALL